MKTHRRLLSVFIAIFIILTQFCGLYINSYAATAEEYYKGLSPIPAILENNINKMKKVNSYGPDFVIDYITTTGKEPDVVNTLNKIQTISDELSAGKTNNYDKIKAFANYVSENIYYDFDAAHNSVTFDIICLQNVLERKRSTCAGFSNLFSALCNAQGIYCVNIRGASPGDGITRATLDSDEAATNHEWTAAYYNNEKRWVYVDNTWNSKNAYIDGEYNYKNSVTRYFDISVELLSIDHKARIVDYRNFFEALTLYQTETPAQTQPASVVTDTSNNAITPVNTDSDKQVTTDEKSSGTNANNKNTAVTDSATVTSVSETSDTIEKNSSKKTSTVKSTDSESSGSKKGSSDSTSETSGDKKPDDDSASKPLVVFLIIIGLGGVSAAGYVFYRSKKRNQL